MTMQIQITEFEAKCHCLGDQMRIINRQIKHMGFGQICTFDESSQAKCLKGSWWVDGSSQKAGFYAYVNFDKMTIQEVHIK